MRSDLKKHLVVAAYMTAALVCTRSDAIADDPQALQLPKAYKSLIASADALSAAGKDLVVTDRTQIRLKAIRTALTWQLLETKFDQTISLGKIPPLPAGEAYPDLSNIELLCAPRESHIDLSAQYGYLTSVVTKVQSLTKTTPPSDLITSLTLLSKRYAIGGDTGGVSANGLNKLKTESTDRCKQDLGGFDSAYYGTAIRDPATPVSTATLEATIPSFSFLGPVGVLVDTLIGVITPVIEQVAALVDQAKREEAIRVFLTNANNQDAIKKAGHVLAVSLSANALAERQKTAGAFVEDMAAFRATTLDLGKLQCSTAAGRFDRVNGAPNPIFILCWRAAWNALEPAVNSLLKVASDYDQLADAGDTRAPLKLFDEITKDLGAIRDGEITNPNLFWGDVMSLINLAKAIETALSKDSRDKVHAAIDSLTKSP